MAKSTSILSYQDEIRAKKKLQAQASVAELQKICCFSPRINSPRRYSGLVSKYKQGENILGSIEKEKNAKNKIIDNIKKEKEVEILNSCTFKPKSLSRIRSDSNIQVKGAERFHEIRDMAKKQQYDKEEREKKLLYKDYTRDLVYSPNWVVS